MTGDQRTFCNEDRLPYLSRIRVIFNGYGVIKAGDTNMEAVARMNNCWLLLPVRACFGMHDVCMQ